MPIGALETLYVQLPEETLGKVQSCDWQARNNEVERPFWTFPDFVKLRIVFSYPWRKDQQSAPYNCGGDSGTLYDGFLLSRARGQMTQDSTLKASNCKLKNNSLNCVIFSKKSSLFITEEILKENSLVVTFFNHLPLSCFLLKNWKGFFKVQQRNFSKFSREFKLLTILLIKVIPKVFSFSILPYFQTWKMKLALRSSFLLD